MVAAGTTADWEMTKMIDFDGIYRFQLTNEESGSYNHHLRAGFETEWTSHIDFDVSFVWDYIKDPRPDSLDITPEQSDVRLTVGLTFTL